MATTFAKNIIYNNRTLKEFKCILCSINESLDINKELGVDFSPITDRTEYNNYTFDFGIEEGDPLKINITIAHCDFTPFDEYTQRELTNWLLPDKNLHWLEIYDDGINDTFYLCRVTGITKKVINNDTIGYSITFTCNSTVGHTDVIEKRYFIDSSSILNIYSDTDSLSYLYPDMIIIPKDEKIVITNMTENQRETIISNCIIDDEIHINGKNLEIYSNQKSSFADSFNWRFFRFVPRVNNTIKVDGSCSLLFRFRNERRVGEF